MSLDINNIEKIEDLLAGRLNSEQSTEIQNLIDQDPLLQSEASFQKDIIDGIQNHRRLELKDRLNKIDVSAKSYAKLYIAAASLATIALTWFGISQFSKTNVEVSDMDETEISSTSDIVSALETKDATPVIEEKKEQGSIETNTITSPDQDSYSTQTETQETTTPTVVAVPDVNLDGPDAQDLESAGNVGEYDENELDNSKGLPGDHKKLDSDIKVNHPIVGSKKHMKYTYVDNELQLVGPFSHENKYVLIQDGSDDVLTLEFLGKTYKIYKGKRNEPLIPVED